MTRDEDGGNALKLACGELEPTRIFTVREIFANELCRGTRSREKKKSPATRLSHCHWDWQCVCGAATAACAVWARADAYIYIKDKVNDWRGPTGWHQVLRGGSPGAPPQTLIKCARPGPGSRPRALSAWQGAGSPVPPPHRVIGLCLRAAWRRSSSVREGSWAGPRGRPGPARPRRPRR